MKKLGYFINGLRKSIRISSYRQLEEFLVMLVAINISIPMSMLGALMIMLCGVNFAIVQLWTLIISIPLSWLFSKDI